MDDTAQKDTLDDIGERVADWKAKLLAIDPAASLEIRISQHYYYKTLKAQNTFITRESLENRYGIPVVFSGDTRNGVRIAVEI